MTNHSHKYICILTLLFLSLNQSVYAAEDRLIFSAPPREPVAKGNEVYAPIANFLSSVIGKKVVYQHPGNWPAYSKNMRNNKYDILFDGPHFVSWRIKHLKHRPLVKIPGDFMFAFVAKKSNNKIDRLTDLIGRKVCGHAPPNQGTLRLYNQLNDPIREPRLVTIRGWRNIYKAMINDKCDAAIVPMKIYKQMDPKKSETKVIFLTRPASGQAITVSSRFNAKKAAEIQAALLSSQGQLATKKLQQRFASPPLVAANANDYRGVDKLLEHSYGFDTN